MRTFHLHERDGYDTVVILAQGKTSITARKITAQEALSLYKDEVTFTDEARLALGDVFQL